LKSWKNAILPKKTVIKNSTTAILYMKKIIVFLFLPISIAAQKNYPAMLEKYMDAQSRFKGFTGTVMVVKQNKVLLRKAYGMADREWKIPNTPETRFEIGSLTKQFTAACILQLTEQGKLNLDDKLSKFFPAFNKSDSVTINMLLNHTSGIPSFTGLPGFDNVARLSWSRDSMISFFNNKPYDFSPGTNFKYNNAGPFLLGFIIEKVSGLSYKDYLRKNIFDRISMSNTALNDWDTILPLRARGYNMDKKKVENAGFISMEWPFSSGALVSTVDDLYKWDRALYKNTILSDISKQKMFTPGKSNYGYGFFIDSLEKHLHIWHTGSIPGFHSNLARFPQDDVFIVVLGNTTIVQNNTLRVVNVLAEGLADIVFDIPVETPYAHREVVIDPALLDKFVGKYTAGLTLEVIKKDNKLYRHRDGTSDIELKPESATKFFYADESNRQLEFELDKAGKVLKIWFINNEQRGEMKKVE
jgi:CubicO group peptidase (beta-lactamase class C family)